MDRNRSLLTAIRTVFILVVILGVAICAVRLCRESYDFGYRIFAEEAVDSAPGQDIIVEITEGMSSADIADLLEEKGLIRDALLFRIQLRLEGYNDSLRAGAYTLNTSMDPKELMKAMSSETSESTDDTGLTDSTESTGGAESTQSTGTAGS